MKVTLNEKTLSVTFQYDIETNKKFTTCTIKDITGNVSFNEARTIATGIVNKTKHDQDIKFIARKYALAKALKYAGFNRNERADVWNQYLKSVKIPKR